MHQGTALVVVVPHQYEPVEKDKVGIWADLSWNSSAWAHASLARTRSCPRKILGKIQIFRPKRVKKSEQIKVLLLYQFWKSIKIIGLYCVWFLTCWGLKLKFFWNIFWDKNSQKTATVLCGITPMSFLSHLGVGIW